ncbi:hypothetical protein RFI_03500 [Reticulomyxa filosa]|uniref:Kelch motif family protein n=1 Tax=Reticulomyxa filosa TaxID=46433 RepID=X6P5X2_RETFI|nr:hypothetical protein RFI_03500 [Reticulomyxa filosa]|eukprot:ETO33601.1 hypothetical protein RFI_03500 [Reticulomyxa filosa]
MVQIKNESKQEKINQLRNKQESEVLDFLNKEWTKKDNILQLFSYLERISWFDYLPDLPLELSMMQCIAIKDEILMCGGDGRNFCYSYHTTKREYRQICLYPWEIQLWGHTVVRCEGEDDKSKNPKVTLLSFGGSDRRRRHTFIMHYESVWSTDSVSTTAHTNEWIEVQDKIIIGASNGHNLTGARACVGGKHNNLLFVTHCPRNINVINLQTYEYIQTINSTLPIHTYWLCYHGFVKLSTTNFILISDVETIGITYDECDRTFHFQILPNITTSFSIFSNFAYLLLDNYILVFGGKCASSTITDAIHVYNVRHKQWRQLAQILPKALVDCYAIASHDQDFIHIIGGDNHKLKCQNSHYAIRCYYLILTKEKIKMIIDYWIRIISFNRLGWIKEFVTCVAEYV